MGAGDDQVWGNLSEVLRTLLRCEQTRPLARLILVGWTAHEAGEIEPLLRAVCESLEAPVSPGDGCGQRPLYPC